MASRFLIRGASHTDFDAFPRIVELDFFDPLFFHHLGFEFFTIFSVQDQGVTEIDDV